MTQTVLAAQKSSTVGAALTKNAVDGVNGNAFFNDGNTLAIVTNGSASPITATFTSVPDPFGRSGDAIVTVPAGAEFAVGPFSPTLFNQGSPNSNEVFVSFSAAASVTLALVSN